MARKIKEETSETIEKILDGICNTIQKIKKEIADIDNGYVSSISLKIQMQPGEVVELEVLKKYLVEDDGTKIMTWHDEDKYIVEEDV